MRDPRHCCRQARRGVILLVVLLLLTLFAIVGLSFVLYAQAQARSAQIFRQAQSQARPDMEPELLLAYFLNQFIYDLNDRGGVYSALRGHSLARLMYGWNSDVPDSNLFPFNGTGRLHTGSGTYMNPFNIDDYLLINYTFFRDDPQVPAGQRFVRDPERLGFRAGLSQPPGPFTGGFNVPYTYPDLNNMFLAAVKADGTVLMPSFHRQWLFTTQIPPNAPNNYTLNNPANPNWTNAWGKYLILRPRPADMGPGFPYPEDPGGDVKNLTGPGYYDPISNQYANNDSVWLDLDAPVMMTPDGTKYKALFAPLIVDLDGRINLNIVGNIRGQNQTHVSNQGWGPWEVNIGSVMSKGGNEWNQLFLGNGVVMGRYGPDKQPATAGTVAQANWKPHFYSQVDYDGCDETTFGPSGPISLQATGFPAFGPPGYGNGSAQELTNHPLLSNYYQPAGDDRVFPISNMEALLRYGDTNSPALTSDLFRLCPTNFQDPRIRNLVTTLSFDVDRPAISPWVYTDPTLGLPSYQLNPVVSQFPQGPPIPFPPLTQRQASLGPPPQDNGEFGGLDWRAVDALLSRVDLNRPLTDYPIVAGQPFSAANMAQFQRAQNDRQQLALDLFTRLVKVTGAFDLSNTNPPALPPPSISPPDGFQPQFDALRSLAQLAANIVDFIDNDDIMTPFPWVTMAGSPAFLADPNLALNVRDPIGSGYVFGTELPRVVVNEAYAEYKATSMTTPPTYQVDVWAELVNPLNSDNGDPNQASAILQMPPISPPPVGAYAVYKFVISKPNTPSTNIRAPNNVWGNPDAIYTTSVAGGSSCIVTDFTSSTTTPPVITPTNGSFSGPTVAGINNQGFYILGSTSAPAGTMPGAFPTSVGSPRMTYQVQPPAGAPPSPTLLLRRLACPYLPPNYPNPDPGDPPFVPSNPLNPYITVDYLENLQVQNSANPFSNRFSFGRIQPYAASQIRRQAPTTALTNQPQNTFFRHNSANVPAVSGDPTLNVPFDWLVSLDRQLISPMELLQISGFKPHELTQQFTWPPSLSGAPMPANFSQRVPWFDEDLTGKGTSHRLYRVFEFLETASRASGMPVGGRLPGKVNLNTIWDAEILQALCDPQPGNSNAFDPGNVNNIFNSMLKLRSPGGSPGPTNVNPPPGYQLNRPFLSLAAGFTQAGDQQYPQGVGINDTFLRGDGSGTNPPARLFQLKALSNGQPVNHPYLQFQLMCKLFNNVTTRSNVFAVWVTVGFFEVTDDSTRPVKLGAEIGRAENRHIRHRMFAIVDRSALNFNPGPQVSFDPRLKSPGTGSPLGGPRSMVVPYFSIIN